MMGFSAAGIGAAASVASLGMQAGSDITKGAATQFNDYTAAQNALLQAQATSENALLQSETQAAGYTYQGAQEQAQFGLEFRPANRRSCSQYSSGTSWQASSRLGRCQCAADAHAADGQCPDYARGRRWQSHVANDERATRLRLQRVGNQPYIARGDDQHTDGAGTSRCGL